MHTAYQVIGTDSVARLLSVDWPREPDFAQISELVNPLIQTPGQSEAYFEHVRVWHMGAYTSMFVDDMSALKKLPVNEAATLIYHANMKRENPDADTNDWPKIHGPAVLFSRNVWF